MARKTRLTGIQVQIEPTYGANPGSWLATHFMLVSNPRFRIDPDLIPRNLIRPYLGASEHLVGTRRAEISFEVELAGSGTAGTAPAWGVLLQGCGMAEAVTASTKVEYTPVSTAQVSLVLRYFIDGVLYTSKGARGNVRFDMGAYGIPKMMFDFQGFDTNATANAMPATDFTAFKKPLVVTDANSGDIRLGSTYSAGAVSGGTALGSKGLMVDLGNRVNHRKLLGGEAIEINDRETTGSLTVELTAADEITWRDAVIAATLTGLSFNIGTVAGSIVQIFGPAVQRVNPQAEDDDGNHMVSADLRFLPSSTSGNDELRVIVK